MQLSLGKDVNLRQESAVWSLKRVREEEAKNESTETGKTTHEHEQPEPTGASGNTSHVEDTEGEKFGRCLAELVAKVEYHHTLSSLFLSVPG